MIADAIRHSLETFAAARAAAAGAAPSRYRTAPRVDAFATEHVAQVRLEVLAMTTCPHRGRKVECGCNGARLCSLSRGESGRVTALNCQRCPVARAELLGRLGRMLPAPDRA